MTALLRSYLFLFFASISFFAQAQNGGHHDHEWHGCHHTKKKLKLEQISPEMRNMVCGSNFRSDSIDVLNYDIDLDITQFAAQVISASCGVRFTAKEDGIDFLPLDLLDLNVDSVTYGSESLTFDHDGLLLNIHLSESVDIGDTMEVVVHYHGHPTIDGTWGGFDFINGYAYNLGIGLTSNPYNFGRSWHPCFDNFVERALYEISLTTSDGRTGYAIGDFLGEEDLGNGVIRRSYQTSLPLPTYLIGVAASNYEAYNDIHSGQYGDYPILLVGKPNVQADMIDHFKNLPQVIDALEYWFGPYRWGQVGYVMTTQGAMEHASLIAYPDFILTGGQSFDGDRLIAHELGHHWWGNITTMECPDDMWIKEGNAEYSAHLFTEYAFGREAFLDQVRNNHYRVLDQVHVQDEGFFPLAGIPFEQTYSDHTYYKGASLMHNLRSYLGDDLFRSGMTSVLETFEYEAIDAQTMEAQLTSATGVDMSHFFNAWMYQPGFADYVIESTEVSPALDYFEVKLDIRQGLREAQMFHTNAPQEVTFISENWEEFHTQVMVDGEFSEVTVEVPFEPILHILNDRQFLNMGRAQSRFVAKEVGKYEAEHTDLLSDDFEVLEIPEGDSALVNIVHHWIGPSAPEDLDISKTHYWSYTGDIPAGMKAKATLVLDGGGTYDLDTDLVENGTDDIILAWRPNTETPWGEYPWYDPVIFGSSGFIKIDTMIPGDYAFANGPLPMATSVADVTPVDMLMTAYPNPASNDLTVQGLLPEATESELLIRDLTGRSVHVQAISNMGREFSENIDVRQLPSGIYSVEVRSLDGDFRHTEKFVKQ